MDATERRNRASTEAADWWALLQGEDMTRAEREAFIDWLRDSQSNVAEMLRLAQVHGVLEQFRDWADVGTDRSSTDRPDNVVALPGASHPTPLERREQVGEGRRLRFIALAASVAAVAIIAAFLVPQFRGQSIVTERGERREVVLADGSVVKVDPQTRLKVQFERNIRRVRLIEGRAVFRVAKNTSRPFLVDAGGTKVRAVGTSFGVDRRGADRVVVTVAEGKVAVSAPNIRPSTAMPSSSHPSSASDPRQPLVSEAARRQSTASKNGNTPASREAEVYLTANEQITVAASQAPQPVQPVDSGRELAWAEGRLVFRNDSIAEVIAEFNRYNRVQLYVSDAQLAARPVSGVFDAANPEGFLAFLRSAAAVQIERDDGRSIVISPRASY